MQTSANIYQRQAARSVLESIKRPNFLAYDLTNDHLLYSKDGVVYKDFLNSTEVSTISGNLQNQIQATNFSLGNYLPLSGGTLSGQLNGTLLSANSLRLSHAELSAYDVGNLAPTNRIYQTIGGNDYWSIYGEGLTNAGSMVLEVGDDLDETIKLRFKKTSSPYTTYTPFIFRYNSFYCDASISATGNAQIDGSLTVGNLSNGFVRSNSSGLLTSSPLVSGDIPSLSNLYLPLSGGTLSGQLNVKYLSGDSGAIIGLNSQEILRLYRPISTATTTFGQTFEANNNIGQRVIYSRIRANIDSSVSGLHSGSFIFSVYKNGVEQTPIQILDNQLKIFGTVSASGNIYTSAFIKIGGTATQFLKANGTVDSNSYALNSSLGNYLPLSGGTLTGSLTASSFVKSGGTSAQVLLANGSVIATSALGSPVVSAFRRHDYQPTLTAWNQMLHTVNCPTNFWTNGYVEIKDVIQVMNYSTESRSMGWGIYLNESADLYFKNESDPATDTKYLIDLMINKVGTEASNTFLRCTGKIENITAGTVEYVDNIAYMNNSVFTAPTTISLDASTAYSSRIALKLLTGLGKTWY